MSKLTVLKEEFTSLKTGIEKIEAAAESAGRDLTDSEQMDVDKLYERASAIKPQIESEAEKHNNIAEVGNILDRISVPHASKNRASAPSDKEMTAGEFLSNALKVQAGLMSADEHLDRASAYIDRASQVVADTAGIVPEPIIGDLIELYDSTRPVFNSFTSRPMPQYGKTFSRPKITQHVATGNQATELTAVASQKMVIGSDTVTKFTEAGYLDLSQQDVDWTDPAALQLVLQDFVKVYSRRTEVRASAFLVAGVTATSTWNISDVGNAVKTFVDAFLAVGNSAEEDPDTCWMDRTSWGQLAQLTNTGDDRTALSMIKETLTDYGVTPPNFVVGRFLATADATPGPVRIVGSSRLVESYEQTNGLLQVAQPDILGQRVAYSGYGAHFITPAGFVKLV